MPNVMSTTAMETQSVLSSVQIETLVRFHLPSFKGRPTCGLYQHSLGAQVPLGAQRRGEEDAREHASRHKVTLIYCYNNQIFRSRNHHCANGKLTWADI